MKIRTLLFASAVVAAPLLIAGCGGSDDTNSGERPTAAEISEGFSSQLPASVQGETEVLDCIGKGLEESDLPNGVLRSIASGEEETQIDADNEEEYTKIITDVSTQCMTEAIGSMTTGS